MDVTKGPGVVQAVEAMKHNGIMALDTLCGNPPAES